MSNEAKKKAREWIQTIYPTDARICGEVTDPLRERDFTDGYNQGRADAWSWRKYPEDKPTLGDTVLTYSEYEHNAEVAWLDECDGFGESWVNSNGEVSQVTHWLPITLPEGER